MAKIEISCPIKFAIIVAELVKQGVRFQAHERHNGEFLITLSGGY